MSCGHTGNPIQNFYFWDIECSDLPISMPENNKISVSKCNKGIYWFNATLIIKQGSNFHINHMAHYFVQSFFKCKIYILIILI
jgi:hypothetical protein